MGKIIDFDLATLVSRRITELLNLTGLTLKDLAKFTGLSYSTLRSASKKSLSLSIDTFSRLCKSFGINLSDFFNPEKILSLDDHLREQLAIFRAILCTSIGQQDTEIDHTAQTKNINTEHKEQREFIAEIIYNSDYFSTARTIAQMVVDFEKEYQTPIKAERLTALLKKYVGLELLNKQVLPRKKRNPSDSHRPYLYSKNIPASKTPF
ncbi:helix-turn-helix transcriptional regulator [Sphingobacterium multivorum]|uniref:helix-turn-helix domain-containing protein n=1 Tax=Sphingobacterium multivorum TaxID=28454 RepID=UPI003019E167